jgi:hypothetical protein
MMLLAVKVTVVGCKAATDAARPVTVGAEPVANVLGKVRISVWDTASTVWVVMVNMKLLVAVRGTRLDGRNAVTLTKPPRDKGMLEPAESVEVATEADQPLQLVVACKGAGPITRPPMVIVVDAPAAKATVVVITTEEANVWPMVALVNPVMVRLLVPTAK